MRYWCLFCCLCILIGRYPSTAGQNRPSQGLSEAGLKAYENMNQFLSAFIERVR